MRIMFLVIGLMNPRFSYKLFSERCNDFAKSIKLAMVAFFSKKKRASSTGVQIFLQQKKEITFFTRIMALAPANAEKYGAAL